MSAAADMHAQVHQNLATLMVSVAGESVTMVKRRVPDKAMKMNKTTEWDIYLEFLKVLFNLADRLSAFYLPIQEQPAFMDGLEDAVTARLKAVLAPALGPGADDMEVTVKIGQTVSESRRRYEPYRFVVTEASKQREEYFKHFAEQVAQLLGAGGNGMVQSTASLCASAVIPAMTALFDSTKGGVGATGAGTGKDPAPDAGQASSSIGHEIKLVSVMAAIQGETVETRWGLHPRFRQDLGPEQVKELNRLMNRVTQILGERYAAVAFSAEWAAWTPSGRA